MQQTNLGKTSDEFKKYFLLVFTEELIRRSKSYDSFNLDEYIFEKTKEDHDLDLLRQEIRKRSPKIKQPQTIKQKVKETLRVPKEKAPIPRISPRTITPPKERLLTKKTHRLPVRRKFPLSFLRIPKPKLPPRFQYLKPTPTNLPISLGKLDPLVNDSNIRSIECNGPDQYIVVRGKMGAKKTEIVLNKEEVDDVINTFSATAKIPLYGGVFHVVAGKLDIAAIISDTGSKFIIEKIKLPSIYAR